MYAACAWELGGLSKASPDRRAVPFTRVHDDAHDAHDAQVRHRSPYSPLTVHEDTTRYAQLQVRFLTPEPCPCRLPRAPGVYPVVPSAHNVT